MKPYLQGDRIRSALAGMLRKYFLLLIPLPHPTSSFPHLPNNHLYSGWWNPKCSVKNPACATHLLLQYEVIFLLVHQNFHSFNKITLNRVFDVTFFCLFKLIQTKICISKGTFYFLERGCLVNQTNLSEHIWRHREDMHVSIGIFSRMPMFFFFSDTAKGNAITLFQIIFKIQLILLITVPYICLAFTGYKVISCVL